MVDERIKGGRKEYLTRWEGYTTASWEPRANFIGDEARDKLFDFLRYRREGGDLAAAGADEIAAALLSSRSYTWSLTCR